MNEFSTINTIKALTLLELPDDAEITQEMIRNNFRKLCLIYHPDQANDRYKDGEKFCQLKEAQDYLIENLPAVNNQIRNKFQESSSYDREAENRRRAEAQQQAQREAEAKRKAEEARRAEDARRKAEEERKAEKARRDARIVSLMNRVQNLCKDIGIGDPYDPDIVDFGAIIKGNYRKTDRMYQIESMCKLSGIPSPYDIRSELSYYEKELSKAEEIWGEVKARSAGKRKKEEETSTEENARREEAFHKIDEDYKEKSECKDSNPTKKSKKLIHAIVLILFLAVFAYKGLCIAATIALDSNNTDLANKLTPIKSVTKLHSPELVNYLNSVTALKDGKYNDAIEGFTRLKDYRDSNLYLTIANIRIGNVKAKDVDYEMLLENIENKEVKKILVFNLDLALKYLEGKWEDPRGKITYWLEDGYFEDSLPQVISGEGSYKIEDGILYVNDVTHKEYEKDKILIIVDEDHWKAFCFKNNQVYMMTRVS